MKKIFSFLLIALLSISAHAEIIQYSPIKPSSGAAQSPWTGNINGSTHYLYNADIRDPAQNPLLDTNNRILNNAYSTGVLDFSGNISNTAGFSFNGNNPVFNAYIEDGNGLKSLNANSSRELFAADGSNQILTWAGTGQDSSYIVSFDTNNAYIRSDLTLGYGGSLHLASGGGGSIDGVNQITAYSGNFTYVYGDGSGLTNLPAPGGLSTVAYSGSYQDLSNVPVSGGPPFSASMTTDLDMSAHVLFDNGGFLRVGTTMFSNSGTSDLGISGQPWVNLYISNIIATGVPTGTIASPPGGLVTGQVWADTTTSATDPVLRIRQ